MTAINFQQSFFKYKSIKSTLYSAVNSYILYDVNVGHFFLPQALPFTP